MRSLSRLSSTALLVAAVVFLSSLLVWSPETEPSLAKIQELSDLIEEEQITTVFYERLVSPELSDALAERLDLGTAVLDTIEGLSDETADEDYVSLMESNLEALRTANGCS